MRAAHVTEATGSDCLQGGAGDRLGLWREGGEEDYSLSKLLLLLI